MQDASLAARMSRLGTESAFEVLAKARALEAQGRRIIHLQIGEPDFDTPAHVVQAAKDALDAGMTHYVPSPGLPALREASSAFLERTRGARYAPDRVVITPGAKPVMFYAIMALCEEGDEVLYPDPGFPMYASIAAFAGARPVPVPLHEDHGFRMDPEEVAALVTDRTKLLILNSPHNPCGSALTREDVEALAALAIERDFHVLTDEVYWAIRYRAEHVSIAALDGMADRTILLDGWSKTFAMTGWRLGLAALPAHLVLPFTRLIVNTVSCTTAFAQQAAIAALDGPWEAIEAMVAEFEKRRSVIVEGLNRMPGVTCREPAGAFYAFPNVTGLGLPSATVADHFLHEAGVACLDGVGFGAAGEGYLRFSYANSVEAIREALDAIEASLPGLHA
jgi:aspartate aminotransferase